MPKSLDVLYAPGHLVRRAHQLAVALYMEEAAGSSVTPVQFDVLNALMDTPGEDQVTLASRVAFDAATCGAVVARLESKGLIYREPDARDKRRKLLWLTPEGEQLGQHLKRAVVRTQTRLLEPLDEAEAQTLTELLTRLVSELEARRDASS